MLVPKLRFKEFTNDWKTKKINDICELLKGGNLSKNDLSTDGTPCILYGELYTRYNEIINNVISKTKVNNLTYSKKNDILMPSSGETAIDIATASCLQCDNIALGGDINILRPYKDNGIFISYQLNGKNKLKIAKLSQGIQVVHMYNDTLKNITINLPSLEEQEKISNFLTLIDKKIELQTQLVDNLNLYKKGLLKKVFSNNIGWNNNQIGNICDISTGNSNTQDSIDNGIYPFFIRSSIIKKSNKYLYDGEAVLTVGDGNIGKVFHYINGKFDYHQRVYKMSGFKKYNIIYGKYFYYYFSTFFYYHVMKLNAKNTVNSVRLDMISKMNIKYPNIKEQKRIANLFTNLDKKIEFETKKLENLKTYKKGLLQKMFI